jgi:hypothetical protein
VYVIDGGIPPFGFLLLGDFPPPFCPEQSGVLYLFHPNGRRVDQVGIRGATLPPDGFSFQKLPDGAPPYDGFDYVTSGGSSTWFIVPQTFGGPNGPEPPLGSGQLETRSWGRTKSSWR